MTKTEKKLGTPFVTIKGSTFREELRVYSSNRENRDPIYRQDAIRAANERNKNRRREAKNSQAARIGDGGSFSRQSVAAA